MKISELLMFFIKSNERLECLKFTLEKSFKLGRLNLYYKFTKKVLWFILLLQIDSHSLSVVLQESVKVFL